MGKHKAEITHNLIKNYFSEATLSRLKPQQGLSERFQRRAQDVTLACKLTHVYGKYHLVMLHRELAMSEEIAGDTSRRKEVEDVYHVNARGGGSI